MNLTKFCPFRCNKFLLLLGDEGARLVYVKNNKIAETIYASSKSQKELLSFTKAFLQDCKAPIYIVLNNIDQNYQLESYPAISSFTLNKILQNRLDTHYAPDEFKAALVSKLDKKTWQANFASATSSEWLQKWIDFVMNKDNPLGGMFLLPVEMQIILPKIKLDFIENNTATSWQLLVVDTHIGGLRLVVYKNQQIIFTRLINITRDNPIDNIATNIMQEVVNTRHYAERFSFKNNDEHEIYLILSPELKNSFIKQKLLKTEMTILTPFELAKKLLPDMDICAEDEPFADLCLSGYLAIKNKFQLKLQSVEFNELNKWGLIKKFECCLASVMLPIALIYLVFFASNIYKMDQENKTQLALESDLSKQVTQLTDDFNNINNGQRISDFFSLYKLVTAKELSPLTLIQEFYKEMPEEVKVNSLNWQLDDNNRLSMSLELQYANNGHDLKKLLDNVDLFIAKLQKHFVGNEVVYRREIDGINLDEVIKSIPLQVTINLKDKGA